MLARLLSLIILLFCLVSSCTATKFATISLTSCNACDQQTLLTPLNGALVKQNEQKIQLHTPTLKIKNFVLGGQTRFLQAIANPTIAYLLLLFGIYGIIFELLNPGFFLPGIIGTLALLMACYGLQFFPVNYTALGLIILGIAFIISEAFTPSYGALGFGGTVAFILGSFFLVDSNRDNSEIARPVLWAMALLNSVIVLSIAGVLFKTRRGKLEHGIDTLVGSQGRTLEIINLNGQAVIKGEIWNVQSKQIIAANKSIRVLAAHGLHLEVEEIADL